MRKRKAIKTGDIFSLKAGDKCIYMQCVKLPEDHTQVELVRIYYKLYDAQTAFNQLNENIKAYFYVGFPLQSAFNRGIVEWVSHQSLPIDFSLPRFSRLDNSFGKGWNIIDEETGQFIYFGLLELNNEQKLMSPGQNEVWNDTLIIEKLIGGWRHYEI